MNAEEDVIKMLEFVSNIEEHFTNDFLTILSILSLSIEIVMSVENSEIRLYLNFFFAVASH